MWQNVININALFSTDLPVALGHATDKCEIVYDKNNIIVWDVPGCDNDYNFYDPESLSFVKSLDKVIVAFDHDIAENKHMLKVIYKLNPTSLILVRTKIDQFQIGHIRTLEEERQLDQQKVFLLLGADLPVYFISAHNGMDSVEFAKFKRMIFFK